MKAAIGVIVTATLLAGVSAPGRTQSLEGTLTTYGRVFSLSAYCECVGKSERVRS